MKSKRLEEIDRYVNDHGFATMEELQTTFGMSLNTIRRDIQELVASGKLLKVYGGVRSCAPSLIPYEYRARNASHLKSVISEYASSMVRDGDIIFIDSGTTTLWMMDTLKDKQNVTIVTNNLEVMFRAIDHPNLRLFVLPGELHRKTHSLAGEDTVSVLQRFNIHIAFMAATGISETGVTNSSPMEYEIKKAAVERSQQKVLLVTGDKFGVTSLLTYASLEDMDLVITDSSIPGEYRKLLKSKKISWIEADKKKKK